jgi:hypothetical protein
VHRLRPLDLLHRHFGQADVPRLARRHHPGHRSPGLFERDLWVHPVQLIEINMVGAQSAQAAVDRLPDMLGAPAPAGAQRVVSRVRGLRRVGDEAYLGRQHRPIAVTPRQRPANQLLVSERAIHISGVDQRHAQVEGLVDDCDGGGVIPRCSHVIRKRHAHAPQAYDADPGSLAAQCRGPHGV